MYHIVLYQHNIHGIVDHFRTGDDIPVMKKSWIWIISFLWEPS